MTDPSTTAAEQRLQDLLGTHAFTHRDAVHPSPPYSLPETITEGLSENQLRQRPHDVNAIVWHLWHLACTEDEGLAVVAGLPRLFDQDAWADRLRYARRNAHGMTRQESRDLAQTIDLDAVTGYRDAVGRRTRDELARHHPSYWFDRFTQADLDRAIENGVLDAGPARGMAGFLTSQTRHALLLWWAVNHSLLHLGQATTLRHQLLAQSGP